MKMKAAAMFGVLLVICVLAYANADEFSGTKLQPEWEWNPGTEEATYKLNSIRLQMKSPAHALQDAQNDLGAKMLQKAPDGDWRIDTHLVTVKANADQGLAGVIVYVDDANWLAIGRQGNKVVARGVIAGQDTGVLASKNGYKAVRILRDTRSADYDRYLFYGGKQGSEDYVYMATFDDQTDALKNAKVGLVCAGSDADFEWFQCSYDIEMERDVFFGKVLDGIWQPLEGTAYKVSGLLSLAADEGELGGIIRAPRHENFLIYEKIAQRGAQSQAGLLVWKDAKNYLLYGAADERETSALVMRDGKENVLFSRSNDAPCMVYQVEKRENTYILRSSVDGISWQDDFTWQDEENTLAGAWYGLGSRMPEKAQVQVFRELAAPDGKILQTNHFRNMGPIFGGKEDGAMNDTVTPYAFRTGDLGSLMDVGDEVYMMMGDSFSGYGAGSDDWRSNVLAILEHPQDPEQGVKIKRMILDEKKEAYAKEVIHSDHVLYQDYTTIPTGGVKVGDRIYWVYDSISQWCKGGHLDSQYAGWAYSDDGGQTFTRVDNFFTPDEEMLFCFPYQQDGYVYLFGSNAKMSGMKLARVPENAILDRSQYVFLAGLDEENKPVWVTDSHEAQEMFDGFVCEFCIVYNESLGRYTMSYLDLNSRCNVIREAENLWGPWSKAVMLTMHENIGQGNYMPSTVNRWVDEKGMYFVYTFYTDYTCNWCHVEFVTEEAK